MTKCNVASTYTYDAWGRTVSMARDGQKASYTYGYGDKLTSVDADWEVTVDYDYNGLGQRVSRNWDSDYTTNYYWNGWSVVNEYYDDGTTAGWSKTYAGGLGERAYSGGAYTYYFTDHLGSTEALYNEAKDRTGGIAYAPYGMPTFTEGVASSVTHRYTGHDWDALTGQYFAPYRYYAPSMHRWLTRDPLGMVDGPNVYGYVGGDASSFKDTMGLKSCDECDKDYQDCMARSQEAYDEEIASVAAQETGCKIVGALTCITLCTGTIWGYAVCVGICIAATDRACEHAANNARRYATQKRSARYEACRANRDKCFEDCDPPSCDFIIIRAPQPGPTPPTV